MHIYSDENGDDNDNEGDNDDDDDEDDDDDDDDNDDDVDQQPTPNYLGCHATYCDESIYGEIV